MNNPAELPAEFSFLAGQVNYVQRRKENEYTSSCPQCGGEPHEDGSYPDRFVMWISNRYGFPFGMCVRGCGYKCSSKKQDASWTEEERTEFREKVAALKIQHYAETEARLIELCEKIRSEKIYERYHDLGMESADAERYWNKRGLGSEEWQRHLLLGRIPDYRIKGELSTYTSPAYTMPVFAHGGRIENVKVRVENALSSNDRFRNIYKSGCQHLHYPQYAAPLTKAALLMEGEVKADVVAARVGLDTNRITIIGAQSKRPELRLMEALRVHEIVYLAFDPDAYLPEIYYDLKTGEQKQKPIAVLATARDVGPERCRFVIPPRNSKFDDAILEGFNFRNALNMAISPERFMKQL